MTKEHRILFELSDLKTLRIVCRECKDEVLSPVSDQRRFLPKHCSNCQAQLSKGSNSLIGQLLKFIHEIRKNDEDMTVGLKFEIEDEGETT